MLEYKSQLVRSRVCSEYSSHAYCFLKIEGMAMLSEHTSNPELKKLALEFEAFYWFDVPAHFYMPARKMSAPYSRAYAWDMRGQGLTYSMLEQVIGKYLPVRLLDDYFDASSSDKYETVYLRDGNVFMAFIPLVPTALPTSKAVQVDFKSGYTVMSFFNYEGEPRNFSKRAIYFQTTASGFRNFSISVWE